MAECPVRNDVYNCFLAFGIVWMCMRWWLTFVFLCGVQQLAQMRETAAARVNADAYLRAREAQFRSRCGDEHAALRSSELMRTFLFDKLSSCAAALMGVTNQQAEDSSGGDNVFFFNEHYVVKPPQTAVEFRWHRDDYEQLGMCVHRSGIPPYLSAWCALDDVTLQNGPLRFVSQSLASSKEQAAADGDACEVTESGRIQLEGKATSPILAAAGAVIFFLSNVWHCSSCNESDTIRRAFYAQYSASQITATPKDPWPLSFAIPCHRAPTDSSKKLTK